MSEQTTDVDTPYHEITKPAFEKDPWDHDYYDFVDEVDSELKLSGTVSNRPSAANAPDDAWYEATDQNLIYRNDATSGWVVIGHGNENNPVPEGHYDSLSTEKANNILFISPSDDPKEIIDGMSEGQMAYFLPGVHSITQTETSYLIPPENSTITGSNNALIDVDLDGYSRFVEGDNGSTIDNLRIKAVNASQRVIRPGGNDVTIKDCIIDVADSSDDPIGEFSGVERVYIYGNTCVQRDGGRGIRLVDITDSTVEANITTGISTFSVDNLTVGDANTTIDGGSVL